MFAESTTRFDSVPRVGWTSERTIRAARAPYIYNLRSDPNAFAKIASHTYGQFMFERAYLIFAVQALAAKFAEWARQGRALGEANASGWAIVDMKVDWTRVFPRE